MSDVEEAVAAPQDAVPAPQGKARWTRLAVLGLLLAAAGPLLLTVATVIWSVDTGENLAFFLPVGLIGLIGAYLLWRFGTWGRIAGIVTAVLVGGAVFWTAFGLAEPSSFFDFVPGVLVVPGILLAISCAIAALVASRRGHLTTAAIGGERRGIQIALTVVAALAVLSGVLTVTGVENVDAADRAAADLEVLLSDIEFDQEEYTVAGGSTVYIRNDDPIHHTFTIEALDVDEKLGPGSKKIVEIPPEPGTYVLYCKPHTMDTDDPEEDDMAATLTVQ
jgi:plastocyanin